MSWADLLLTPTRPSPWPVCSWRRHIRGGSLSGPCVHGRWEGGGPPRRHLAETTPTSPLRSRIGPGTMFGMKIWPRNQNIPYSDVLSPSRCRLLCTVVSKGKECKEKPDVNKARFFFSKNPSLLGAVHILRTPFGWVGGLPRGVLRCTWWVGGSTQSVRTWYMLIV